MQFRYLTGETLFLKSLPISARVAQESATLAEKLATQIEWMRAKGIDISLKDSERPRPAQKPPLPGTVIYFSKTP